MTKDYVVIEYHPSFMDTYRFYSTLKEAKQHKVDSIYECDIYKLVSVKEYRRKRG